MKTMKLKNLPKITQRIVCITCGGKEKLFVHGKERSSYNHVFKPCKETKEEAFYRAGYEKGYHAAMDKVHWGD